MSPEQAEGSVIDLRSDIYSLGVMLFELCTGTMPFSGTTPLITAAARLLKPAPDPRSRRPELFEGVALVVLRCLCRQPQERYASAEEVAAALDAALKAHGGSASGAFAGSRSAPFASIKTASSPRGASVTDGPVSLSSGTAFAPVMPSTAGAHVTLDAPPAGKAIAVLPFRNQGPLEDAYLADGLTDDLIDALSMVPGLRVRSRGAVLSYAEKSDPAALGKALGVDILVEGTVRRGGPQLRIAARLIKADDGIQVWAQRFDRPEADALKVSDEVTQAVASALTISMTAAPRQVPSDAEAVELYLRARALAQLSDPESVRKCIPIFERALELRPSDPSLLMAYAQARARLWFYGGEALGELARAAAERAVAAAPERGESHLALATVRFHVADPVAAVRELRQALKLAPNLAPAHDLLGRIFVESGDPELGLRYIEQALMLEPWLARTQLDRPRVQALLGNWAVADRLLEELWQADPTAVGAGLIHGRLALWRQERARAEEYLKRPEFSLPHMETPRRLLEIAAGRVRLEPRTIFPQNMSSALSSPRGRCFFYQAETEIYSLYGETDNAIRSMARAVDVGLYDRLWFDGCPLLDPLRKDLRFFALRKMVIDRARRVGAESPVETPMGVVAAK